MDTPIPPHPPADIIPGGEGSMLGQALDDLLQITVQVCASQSHPEPAMFWLRGLAGGQNIQPILEGNPGCQQLARHRQ